MAKDTHEEIHSPDNEVYQLWWQMHDSASFDQAREILAEALAEAYQAGRDDIRKLFNYE